MVRYIYQTETDVIKMEKRFTTEDMGKMVLEQAKGESLVNYMNEHFERWFAGRRDETIEIFIDDDEIGDEYLRDYDCNFEIHDELLKSIGIDLEGEQLSWVMEHSYVELYKMSEAFSMEEIARDRKDGKYDDCVFSQLVLKDLDSYK